MKHCLLTLLLINLLGGCAVDTGTDGPAIPTGEFGNKEVQRTYLEALAHTRNAYLLAIEKVQTDGEPVVDQFDEIWGWMPNGIDLDTEAAAQQSALRGNLARWEGLYDTGALDGDEVVYLWRVETQQIAGYIGSENRNDGTYGQLLLDTRGRLLRADALYEGGLATQQDVWWFMEKAKEFYAAESASLGWSDDSPEREFFSELFAEIEKWNILWTEGLATWDEVRDAIANVTDVCATEYISAN